ncbi:MAG: PhoPQ-activated pathogenicity-related family protein [Armatimonadota bacterium]|nr:PhoPQ-activated pathogenicity-related family protein [Armatimonadota bacterium]
MNRIPNNMRPRALSAVLAVIAVMLAGCGSRATPARAAGDSDYKAPLDAYIQRPEAAYKWEKVAGEPTANGAGVYELKLTSQEWQGQPWTHRVQVIRPAQLKFPDTALIFVTFGTPGLQETLLAQIAANSIGATFVNLFGIPNQPLYGMREDDLIAHTFQKYLETGDDTWPLLFPMTKSVVKAMDAMEEFSKQEWKQPVTRFIISGASKRGWTTWLTGAVDRRVIGIIPLVYDNLNLEKQMPHQIETWGKYSEMIEDYTRRGLQQQMETERGRRLGAMVDPYTYRDRLTMPKLIINGTNDPYWTLDSFNLYRSDLQGPTNVLYVPNAGHNLGGQEQYGRIFGTTAAWFQRVAAGQEVPTVATKAAPVDAANPAGPHRFTVTTNAGDDLKTVRLWVARSATRDFRKAKWEAVPMTKDKDQAGSYHAEVPAGEGEMKYAAAIGEVEIALEDSPLPLRLSSPVVIVGGEGID